MAKYLLGKAGDQDLTITGGEPFLQPEALARLLAEIRLLDHSAGRTGDSRRQIVVYTGYTWEDLLDLAEAIPAIAAALSLVDVLVDGPYIARLDDLFVQWRGSRNQRVIDVQASFANGALREPAYSLRGDVDGDDRLVLLDWDTPTLTLADGQLVGATGLMRELFDAKDLQPTARCGEPDR
jgi:organic radical activating enzyme